MAKCKTWIDPSIRGTWTPPKNYKNSMAKERERVQEKRRAQRILKDVDAKPQKGKVITAAKFTAQLDKYMTECFEQKQPPVASDFAKRLGYSRRYFSGTSSSTNIIIHDRIEEFQEKRDEFWEQLTEWAEEQSYRLTVKNRGEYSLKRMAKDYKWPKNNIYRSERWRPVKDAVYRGIERGKAHVDNQNNSVIARHIELND